ncbi:hypothetical protein J8L84_01760 [Alteromonas sp. MMG017]|uniref:hypothetical protein n=1 Tax=Alteromonas sp. MMG017 TaxID=2822692 RepID=UPI001B3A07FA|nr:hypothetical protein [Alteromonas sp. MMG017]MBQ4828001.1 hypothetical protein [Alteromonas sp. MMG017]
MAPINNDESVHSLIIRRMLLHGVLHKPKDLQGVISPSGVVYGLPTLNKKQTECIRDIDTTQFASIIDNNAPYLGADLKVRTQIAKHVLENNADRSYRDPASRTQLRYCVECAELQLRSLGYSYFKIDWLHSARCSVHKAALAPCITVMASLLWPSSEYLRQFDSIAHRILRQMSK